MHIDLYGVIHSCLISYYSTCNDYIYRHCIRNLSSRGRAPRDARPTSHRTRVDADADTEERSRDMSDASTSSSSARGGNSRERVASQRVSTGGLPGGRRPAQKAATFSGYAESSELAVGGGKATTTTRAGAAAGAGRARRRRPNHPWLDYPPDFERKFGAFASAAFRVLNPANLLAPFPPAVRYSLTRNFGFVTKTFTQFFDKDGVQSVQESIGLGK